MHFSVLGDLLVESDAGPVRVPGREERLLLVLPLFHVYGMTVGMLLSAIQGGTMILIPKFDINLMLDAINPFSDWEVLISGEMFIMGFRMASLSGIMFGPQPRDDYNSAVGRSTKIPVIVIYSKQESANNSIRFPYFNDGAMTIVERSTQTQVGSIFDPHIQNPYTGNLYFGVQRSLTSTLMFETAFVGNRGIKYRLRRQYNEVDRITGLRRNPNLGAGRYFTSNQNTVYISWQTSVRKRYSKNLSGAVHYTWGKALAYAGGDTGADFSGDTFLTIQDFFNVRANRGPSAATTQPAPAAST